MPQATEQPVVFFVGTAIGLSIAVFDITFFYGVYGTIFFDRLLLVWVVATAIALAHLMVPRDKAPLHPGSVAVLLVPTIWLLLRLLDDPAISGQPIDSAILWTSFVVWLVSLPYIGYLVIGFTNRDVLSLDSRYLYALVLIVALIGSVGYLLGAHNDLFLSCTDFDVSGNYVPSGCTKGRSIFLVP